MSIKSRSDRHFIIKRGDIIIIAAVLLVAVIAVLLLGNQKEGNKVIITSCGEEVSYPLDKDRVINVSSKNGGHNVVIIFDGKVLVKEADCKNQICVKHSPIYKDHESIACLPNKMFIKIVSDIDNDIDN